MSAPPTVFREPGIVASVLKLLRLRLVILLNGFRRAKKRAKIRIIILIVCLLGFLSFLLGISTALLAFLRSPLFAHYAGNTAPLLESFPSMIMSIAGIGILFTSFGVLLQTLYLSGDMGFLMSAPVPIRAIFLAKMIQAVLPNFIILCIVTLPALFGLGISGGYRFLYYPWVVVVLTAIALTAAALASLLVLIVARFFPPRRVAEVLGFIVGLSLFISSQSARYMNFGSPKTGKGQMAGIARVIERFNHPWSPLAWAGRGLIELGRGEWALASGLIAAALILSGIILCAALVTSERLYCTGWAALQGNRGRSKRKLRTTADARATGLRQANPLARLVPTPVRAILRKDLRLCLRDLSNLSGLLFPLILGVLYAVGLIRSHWQMPVGRGKAPAGFIQAGNAAFLYGDIALALFLGWALIANLAGLAFTREGKNYWMLKSAPVSTRQILTAKLLVSYIPAALICSAYILALEILKRVDPYAMMVSLISVWMMVAGLCGIYLAFGTRGARFDWENPAQRNRSVGCLGMLTGLFFLPVCFALFIAPAVLAQLFRFPVLIGRLAGLVLGGVASALAVIIPLAMVEKRVSTLNET